MKKCNSDHSEFYCATLKTHSSFFIESLENPQATELVRKLIFGKILLANVGCKKEE